VKLWFERGAWASRRGRRAIEQLPATEVKRIAVVRHAALGDMVLVRPFLKEARAYFPNAEIVLSLVSHYTYGAPVDLVDSVHVMQGHDQREASLGARIARARSLGPVDILFDLADTTRSRQLCLLSQAKIKIGFPYRWYLRHLLLDAAVARSDFTFEAITMLDTLMLLGADPQIPPDFAWPADLRASEPPVRRIVYFPFASVDDKRWPTPSFYALIEAAAQRHPDYEHVVLAGVGAHEHTDSYKPLVASGAPVRLQASMPLEDTMRFIGQSSLMVSNDTGIRNLAIALDTPTLGIFFATVPYRYWPRYGAHQAIFKAEGPPRVADVLEGLTKLLLRLDQTPGR
jgi:ADP-heptose:LPS heptosyltransferase